MKQNPKTVTRTVKLLTNPNPSFVSVVNHGAIQEPFTSLKHAQPTEGNTAMAIRKLNAPAKKAEVAKKSSGKVGVRKLEFATSVFKTEDDVKAYLDANDYDGYEITKSDSAFTAQAPGATDDDFIMKNAKEVPMAAGVSGTVAFKAIVDTEATEEGEGDPEPVAKSAAQETSLKFDWWNAYTSKGETVSKVLSDGMVDGIPPGLDVVVSATMTAIGNVLSGNEGDKAAKVATITSEFGALVVAVDTLYVAATADANAQKHANVKKFIEGYTPLTDVLEPVAKTDEDPKEPVKEPEPAKEPVKEPEPAAKTDPVQVPATPTAFDPAAFAAMVSKAVSDATAPLQKRLDDVQKTVDTASKNSAAAVETATKAVGDLSAIASRASTKKGVENGTETQVAPKDQAKVQRAEEAASRLRTTIGL